MAFESFKARIAMLLEEIATRPEDGHVIQEQLREKLSEMRALGLPLPQDLVELERLLEEDLEPRVLARRAPRPRPEAGS